jgi:hypothetical protein
VKRTAESHGLARRGFISRPFHGLGTLVTSTSHPSTKVLGYFHSSASRTGRELIFGQSHLVPGLCGYGALRNG